MHPFSTTRSGVPAVLHSTVNHVRSEVIVALPVPAEALVHEGRRAVRLVLGTLPIFVVAGLIEGTISQMHAPLMPYWLKLAFALLVGTGLFGWLLLAGRAPDSDVTA